MALGNARKPKRNMMTFKSPHLTTDCFLPVYKLNSQQVPFQMRFYRTLKKKTTTLETGNSGQTGPKWRFGTGTECVQGTRQCPRRGGAGVLCSWPLCHLPSKALPSFLFSFSFPFLSFLVTLRHMKFSHGSDLSHSQDLSRSSSKARSVTTVQDWGLNPRSSTPKMPLILLCYRITPAIISLDCKTDSITALMWT